MSTEDFQNKLLDIHKELSGIMRADIESLRVIVVENKTKIEQIANDKNNDNLWKLIFFLLFLVVGVMGYKELIK